ncbi:MAG: putative T7SS-secreted protein [Marmoricola sp.]
MWLGGDPEAIRHTASRLRALTDTLTADREIASRRLRSVEWESVGADAFRRQSVEDFALYDQASAALDDVARALDQLASTLAHRQQALVDFAADVGRTVEEIWSEGVSGARHVLHDITGGLL